MAAEKSDAGEQKLCFQRRSLITKLHRKTEQSINGHITRRTPDITCTSTSLALGKILPVVLDEEEQDSLILILNT